MMGGKFLVRGLEQRRDGERPASPLEMMVGEETASHSI